MIVIKEAPGKEFANKLELIKFLKDNRNELINLKKNSAIKITDDISIKSELINSKSTANKSESVDVDSDIKVKIVLNTTNFLDSHGDVHLKGIWNRTLKNSNTFYHLQEHKNEFNKVISTDVKAYVEEISFKSLGVNSELSTQALIFESTISKERNPEMYKQYRKGWVNNHSVGMQYVDMDFAIYDKEDEKELDFWNKHIKEVANPELAEERGYFWVISEAKLREGSAVLFGSNPITPTLEMESDKSHPSKDTDKSIEGPSKDTPQVKRILTNLI